MAGPSDAWMASLDPNALDLPPDTITPAGARFAPAPAVYSAPPSAQPWQGDDPLAGLGPPSVPKGAGSFGGYDPLADREATWNPVRDPVSFTRGEDPEAPSAGAALPPAGPAAPDVQFSLAGGGGVVPAREAPTRGPMANAFLEHGVDVQQDAAEQAGLQRQLMARREADLYAAEAEQAVRRQEAMEQTLARRQQQMEAMRIDFEDTVQKLGEAQLDSGRYWARKSTLDKIGTGFLMFVGGALGKNGRNLVAETVSREIDDDVAEQRFAYDVGLNQAKARQSAYGMLMQQYGQEDLATAGARDAALAATEAKVRAIAAEWKGTEAQANATEMLAHLESERMKTRAAGLKYLPASLAPERYRMTIRGQEIPGLVSREQAQQYAAKYGVEPAIKVDEEMVKGGIKLAEKRVENEGKREERQAEREDKRAQFVSEAEARAGIPAREAQIRAARDRHRDAPITSGERFVDWGLGGLNFGDSPMLYKAIHGREKAEREQAWKAIVVEVRHDLAGANVTPEEEKPIMAALEGANDQESRMFALRLADERIAAQKASIRGGVSDSGRGFDANRSNVPDAARGPSGISGLPSFRPSGR